MCLAPPDPEGHYFYYTDLDRNFQLEIEDCDRLPPASARPEVLQHRPVRDVAQNLHKTCLHCKYGPEPAQHRHTRHLYGSVRPPSPRPSPIPRQNQRLGDKGVRPWVRPLAVLPGGGLGERSGERSVLNAYKSTGIGAIWRSVGMMQMLWEMVEVCPERPLNAGG